jgi:hypothetical protein
MLAEAGCERFDRFGRLGRPSLVTIVEIDMTGVSALTASSPIVRLASTDAPWGAAALRGLEGTVTLYAELRVVPAQHDAFLAAVDTLAGSLRATKGFIHLALKQMSGDSTMVKNYPEAYKGMLATAYLDGVAAGTLPYFYSLFVRFENADTAAAAGLEDGFAAQIGPWLNAAPDLRSRELAAYRGIFQTVAAGDREGIYRSNEAIVDFLRRPVDHPERETVTVENHVMTLDAGGEAFESRVGALLDVAQNTFEPQDDPEGVGQPGSKDNRAYHRALSTEILRNAHPDGRLRAYLMHGVWESVWDHENSHLDPRFLRAAGAVGAEVVIGPVEPFYLTRMLALQS